MKTVYLIDGRKADLITKTDKGYLVDPYIQWANASDEMEESTTGNIELADRVFDSAPIDFIEAKYKVVLDNVEAQNKVWEDRQKELRLLNNEIANLRNQKTDLSRYIINREELRTGKRLIIWPTSEIVPRILDGNKSNKFIVSYDISQYKGEEKVWCYEARHDDERGYSSNSQYFDSEYGIKIDLTDEEILALTIKRVPKFKKDFHSWKHVLLRTPDEWLSPELIEEKRELKSKEKQEVLDKALQELKAAQERVDKLNNPVTA